MSDYERLKKYAAAAKAGPWSPFITGNVAEVVDNLGKPIINWMGFDDSDIPLHVHKNNARFIAAANPAVVLDLIARAEAAERELAALKELLDDIRECPFTLDKILFPAGATTKVENPDQIVGFLSMRLPLHRRLHGLPLPEPPEDEKGGEE